MAAGKSWPSTEPVAVVTVREEPMAHTAVAALQAPWDCKWTRLAYRQSGIPEYQPPDPRLWVCVREPAAPRPVAEQDCDGCPHWEMDEGDPPCHP